MMNRMLRFARCHAREDTEQTASLRCHNSAPVDASDDDQAAIALARDVSTRLLAAAENAIADGVDV
jgi:hypothetical protein